MYMYLGQHHHIIKKWPTRKKIKNRERERGDWGGLVTLTGV